MRKPSRLDYAFAVGRVRALEKYLIQQAVFLEASETTDFSAALKVLYDAGRYSEDMIKAGNSGALDAFLDREGKNTEREMADLVLEKDVLDTHLLMNEPGKALGAAEQSGYPFLLDYVRHRIDLGNIKVFCRAKYLGFSADFLKLRLLPGGLIEPRTFIDSYALPLADLARQLRASPYSELLIHGVEILAERETFVALERGSEDFLMDYLRRARRVTFGPEPVFAYAEAKRREFQLIRLVGVGKFVQLPPELLRERISETYV
jgi:V/A-type H+-transporting ATPase subunit C